MSFTEQFIETGTILLYAGPSDNIPDGYLLCDGSTINKSDYPTLFSVLVFTNGSIATTTQLPNLEEKFIQGKTPVTSDISYVGSGNSDISNIHMPNHEHNIVDPNSVTWEHTHIVNLNGRDFPTSVSNDSANARPNLDNPIHYTSDISFLDMMILDNEETTSENPTIISIDLSNNYTSVDTLNKYIVLNYIIKT